MAYRLGSRYKMKEGVNLKQDEDTKKLDELFKKVESAIDKRNNIVHSSWHLHPSNSLAAYRMSPRGRQNTGFPGGSMETVSVSEIEEDTNFIQKTTDELWKYYWDNFGVWIAEQANRPESKIQIIK